MRQAVANGAWFTCTHLGGSTFFYVCTLFLHCVHTKWMFFTKVNVVKTAKPVTVLFFWRWKLQLNHFFRDEKFLYKKKYFHLKWNTSEIQFISIATTRACCCLKSLIEKEICPCLIKNDPFATQKNITFALFWKR